MKIMNLTSLLQLWLLAVLCLISQANFGQGARILFPDDPSLNALNAEPQACDIPGGGAKGECLPLEECPELLALIKSRNGIQSRGTADLLNQRICKRLERNVHLCCRTSMSPVPVPSIVPSLEDCGFTVTRRISNGHEISHGEHPWLAGVGYPSQNSFSVHCGGTLITRKHVLTAAHCFVEPSTNLQLSVPKLTHVILGEHSLSTTTERVKPIVLEIVEVKDPGYNTITHYNDIALAVLEEEVTFTPYIRPACLPFDNFVKHFDLKNQFSVVGWGHTYFGALEGTDVPLQAKIYVVPKAECKKAYEAAPELALDDTQICLGQDGKDACQSDSGGPLIYTDSSVSFRSFVAGIVSLGIECGNDTYPGVYTYVPRFTHWIVDNL